MANQITINHHYFRGIFVGKLFPTTQQSARTTDFFVVKKPRRWHNPMRFGHMPRVPYGPLWLWFWFWRLSRVFLGPTGWGCGCDDVMWKWYLSVWELEVGTFGAYIYIYRDVVYKTLLSKDVCDMYMCFHICLVNVFVFMILFLCICVMVDDVKQCNAICIYNLSSCGNYLLILLWLNYPVNFLEPVLQTLNLFFLVWQRLIEWSPKESISLRSPKCPLFSTSTTSPRFTPGDFGTNSTRKIDSIFLKASLQRSLRRFCGTLLGSCVALGSIALVGTSAVVKDFFHQHCKVGRVATRWAPTSYKWSYIPYTWPYN